MPTPTVPILYQCADSLTPGRVHTGSEEEGGEGSGRPDVWYTSEQVVCALVCVTVHDPSLHTVSRGVVALSVSFSLYGPVFPYPSPRLRRKTGRLVEYSP